MGYQNGMLKCYNFRGQELLSFKAHAGEISSICFSPDGSQLLTAADDGTIKLWTLEGHEIYSLEHEGNVGFIYTSAIFSLDGNSILTTSQSGAIQLHLMPWTYLDKYVQKFSIARLKRAGLECTDADLARMRTQGKLW